MRIFSVLFGTTKPVYGQHSHNDQVKQVSLVVN